MLKSIFEKFKFLALSLHRVAISLSIMTHLAVPIAARTPMQASEQIACAIAAGANILELRLDYLENLTVELTDELISDTKATTNLPIIVTCRDKQQGGSIEYPADLCFQTLLSAIISGADFIDFEFENLNEQNKKVIAGALSKNPDTRLILSAHNFQDKFDDIKKLYGEIKAEFPNSIPKLIYTAKHINDCFEAFDLLHSTDEYLISFCMGEAGLISRILAKKLGSFVTFASIDEDSATAPGQLTIDQFKELYRYDFIEADTELYGIIGSPVSHSLSPNIHNACLAEIGADKLYLPLLVEGGKEDFDKFMGNIFARGWLDFRGFSVTIPHKQNAINFVSGNKGVVEPLTEKIGAANTLIIDDDGKTYGYNTDYCGALDAITSTLKITRIGLKGLPIAIMGAGGVSRAITAGLTDCGAKVKIYNRTLEKAEKLAAEFGCEFGPQDDLLGVDTKLLINCTSIGMYPNIDASGLPSSCHHKGMVVFDTVYNPQETLLLQQAKEAGAKTINGVDMFINQAMAQFQLFTGTDANPNIMRNTISDCLNAK